MSSRQSSETGWFLFRELAALSSGISSVKFDYWIYKLEHREVLLQCADALEIDTHHIHEEKGEQNWLGSLETFNDEDFHSANVSDSAKNEYDEIESSLAKSKKNLKILPLKHKLAHWKLRMWSKKN